MKPEPSEALLAVLAYMRAYFTPQDYGRLKAWLFAHGNIVPMVGQPGARAVNGKR